MSRYSVYNRKTDLPAYIGGTSAQCAASMGVTVDTFYCIFCRQRKGYPSKTWEIFVDEEDPDEDL